MLLESQYGFGNRLTDCAVKGRGVALERKNTDVAAASKHTVSIGSAATQHPTPPPPPTQPLPSPRLLVAPRHPMAPRGAPRGSHIDFFSVSFRNRSLVPFRSVPWDP